MLNKPLEQITKEDIEALLTNEVAEGKRIEYKEQLPGNSDGDKKEFLADVSSFANAGGGYLIYGVTEKRGNGQATGIPESINGLVGINSDNEISRLEGMVLTAIEPRIPGVHFRFIDGFSDGPIIIIYIPKSWAGPHTVTYKNTSRFYSRTSNGKTQMDVDEIRSAFLRSEGIYEKINRFRQERIDLMLARKNPVTQEVKPTVVMHLVPLGFEDPSIMVDIAKNENILRHLQPLYPTDGYSRFNFYGYFVQSMDETGKTLAYTQFYRSGIIESVSGNLIRVRDGSKFIAGTAFPERLIASLKNQIETLRSLDISPPFILMLTLLHVKGFSMATHSSENYTSTPIDKENPDFPEILIEDMDAPVEKILQPLFDMVWQACGIPRCLHYDDQGNWVQPR